MDLLLISLNLVGFAVLENIHIIFSEMTGL